MTSNEVNSVTGEKSVIFKGKGVGLGGGVELNLSGAESLSGRGKRLNFAGIWTYPVGTYPLFFDKEREEFGSEHDERLNLSSIWTYLTWTYQDWIALCDVSPHRHARTTSTRKKLSVYLFIVFIIIVS